MMVHFLRMTAVIVVVVLLIEGTEGATKPEPKAATGSLVFQCKRKTNDAFCTETLGGGYGIAFVGPRKQIQGKFTCDTTGSNIGQCCPSGVIKTEDSNTAETFPVDKTSKCATARQIKK